MTARTESQHPTCPDCGWPLHRPPETLSRHRTSEGTVVYTRCVCGRVRAWLEPVGAIRLLGGA
ncbi:hypothetical protein [Nocardia sp. NPDC050406]|uniref:hypothetical protein n=1 Tax=Nocardia sp. NPDC050406 TaxID=3364318 RepID=UPI003790B4C4